MARLRRLLLVMCALLVLFVVATSCSRRDALVSIAEEDRRCSADTECTLVATSCGGCTCGDAITRKLLPTYTERFDSFCEHNAREVCKLDCPPSAPACLKGRCRLLQAAASGGARPIAAAPVARAAPSAGSPSAPSASAEPELAPLPDLVPTPAEMECSSAAECRAVTTSCNSCGCDWLFVNRTVEAKYSALAEQKCRRSVKPSCGAVCFEAKLTCREGRCAAAAGSTKR